MDAAAAWASSLWASRSGWRAGRPAAVRRVWFATSSGSILDSAAPQRWEPSGERRAGADDTPIGRPLAVLAADGTVWVHAEGAAHQLTPLTRRAAMERMLAARDRAHITAGPELRSPMPGTVVAVHVADGATVASGDRVVTIEAMKMEQSVVASHDGVAALAVAVGDQVSRDQVIATVHAAV